MRAAVPAVWSAVMLLVGGCATPPRPVAPPGGEVVSGRFAARYTGPDGMDETGVQGRFVWRRDAGGSELEILSPFGQAQATVSAGRDGARLVIVGGETRRGENPDALLAEALGFTLPFSRLGRWLHCDTPAGAPVWDDAGWRLDCSAYREHGRIVVAGRAGGQSVNLRVALDRPDE